MLDDNQTSIATVANKSPPFDDPFISQPDQMGDTSMWLKFPKPVLAAIASDLPAAAISLDDTASPGTTEICYGAIPRTVVRLSGDMLQLDHRLQQTSVQYGFGFTGLELRDVENTLTLHFPNGAVFGVAHPQFHADIHSLISEFSIRLEAIINIANVRERIRSASKVNDANVRVDVNIFGPRENAEKVGKRLSDAKLWLQKPEILKRGTEHHNPHFLILDGWKMSSLEVLPVEIDQEQGSLETDDKNFKQALDEVMNNLTRSKELQRVEKDRRIKTKLLQYESPALDSNRITD
jgi:hypothetical protein